jgi:hypothetical protein
MRVLIDNNYKVMSDLAIIMMLGIVLNFLILINANKNIIDFLNFD